MAGSVFSEMQGTLTRGDGRKNEWSQKEIDDQLTAAFGDKKDDIVAEFKQAFPRKKVQDVLYYAGGSRPGVKNLLTRKLEKTKAPVYNYLFAWEYPINGGITVVPLLRAGVLLPRPERAADPDARPAAVRWRWRCRTRSRRRGSTSPRRAIPASRGSSGSRTRRRIRRRWCSTPSASRSRSRDDKLVSLLPPAGGPPAAPPVAARRRAGR